MFLINGITKVIFLEKMPCIMDGKYYQSNKEKYQDKFDSIISYNRHDSIDLLEIIEWMASL